MLNGRFEWHGFDRDKILLDPYAKSVFFSPAFDRLAAFRPGSKAGKAPLGVLTGDSERFDWQEGAANAWRRVVDTSLDSPFDFLEPLNESPLQSLYYQVPGRTVVMLAQDTGGVQLR